MTPATPTRPVPPLARLCWQACWLLLCRWTPRPLHGWRALVLRTWGAQVGRGAHVYPSARIYAPWHLALGDGACLAEEVVCYNVARIELGARATVSIQAFLCTASHDIDDPAHPLVSAPISIGAGAWVCARAWVGPGIAIGEGAVVAATATAVHDVPAWTVVGGNPARRLRDRGR